MSALEGNVVESPRRALERLSPRRAFVVGALTGGAIGLVEALYALYFSTRSATVITPTLAMIIATTSLTSALVAFVLSVLARLAHWSDELALPPRVRLLARALVAIASAGPALLVLRSIAARKHALLGSLVVALSVAASTIVLSIFARALARLSARGRGPSQPAHSPLLLRLSIEALSVLAPVLASGALSRWPLSSAARGAIVATAGLSTLVAPWIADALAPRLHRARLRAVLAASLALSTALFAAALYALRSVLALVPLGLLPWLLAPGLLWALHRRGAVRSVRAPVIPLLVVAQLFVIALATRSEPARKIVATRALATQLSLTALRAALDWDHDGHARWVPGGDCRDDDPSIHPGAMDWPGDGVDSDCNGDDEQVSVPPRRPFIVVPESVPARPNVLLITVDALRADHLGTYGYRRPTTPSLDALARQSVLFERAFANAPSTRLSMPAIATGRWAPAIEWDHSIWWPRFTSRQRTIAEVLHEQGYHTGGVFSIPYFRRSDARGFERGVDEYDDGLLSLHAEVGGPQESTGTSAREVADHARSFVENNRERPWFLWAHFFDPHHQYVAHDDGETPFFGTAPIDRYDAEVRFTDRHIGRLLDRVRETGQWERTVVIVTGDHGEGFGEHSVQTHGFHLYAAQTRVPMIVRVPGVRAKRSRVPVSHVDVAPTIANLAGASNERSFLGRTMVDAIAYTQRPDDDGEVLQEVTFDQTVHRWGIVSATHHVLWNQSPDSTRECYDLRTDPDEREDLTDSVGLGAPCALLYDQLTRYAVGLRLGPDFAERLSFGVIPSSASTPPIEHPVAARFGTVVDLRGWDGPTVIERGREHTFTLHFTVVDRVEPGWELFVHLIGAQQSRNFQHDVIEGTFPIPRWRPGQRLRDRFTARVPSDFPQGEYSLFIGFYKGDERMPITPPERADESRRVMLGRITVR
ncbi:MAG: sulfatase [Polyangiales bacterium]